MQSYLLAIALLVLPVQDRFTALQFAALNGHTAIVQALLSDPRVCVGESTAVRGGIVGFPRRLLKTLPRSQRGETALDLARRMGHADVVRVLEVASQGL